MKALTFTKTTETEEGTGYLKSLNHHPQTILFLSQANQILNNNNNNSIH